MLDEKRLILELKQGNKEALRRIYMEYKDNLLTIAASLLHDTHTAEDVLHDVFVSFAGSISNIRLRGSLKSYLTASVVNRVRDMYRKKKHFEVELEQAGQLPADSDGPVRNVEFGEQAGRLTDALARLPIEQRETIVLHLNGGMKFKEISRLQKIPLSTVQGRYRYGLDKLRAILKESANK
jgi:RNA polymerase sigma factor (sigma-70 family)